MPILGAHLGVTCAKCHPAKQFDLPFANPESCDNNGCHTSTHVGQFIGTRPCEWCHSPTFKSFKVQSFDHTARSRFDLGRAHGQRACTDCHTKALGLNAPSSACESCHAKDSPHGNRFKAFGSPLPCGTCHTVSGEPSPPRQPKRGFARLAFDHTRHTTFPLRGKHATITCRACHRGTGRTFEDFKGSTLCMDCHAHKKVHAEPSHPNGKYTNAQCLKCHLH